MLLSPFPSESVTYRHCGVSCGRTLIIIIIIIITQVNVYSADILTIAPSGKMLQKWLHKGRCLSTAVMSVKSSEPNWPTSVVVCLFSSQMLFSISQKLIQHQILNYTEILKWLREILICHIQFLQKHRDYANVGSNIPICRQAHIKLEVTLTAYILMSQSCQRACCCMMLLLQSAFLRWRL